jgi:hypothetical protein
MQEEAALEFNEKEVVVTSTELSFKARAEPARWNELMVSLVDQQPPNSEPWLIALVAIPEPVKPGGRFLSASVQCLLNKAEEPEVQWSLALKPAPTSMPPPSLIEASKRAGGYPGILERILLKWPAERRLKMSLKATFLLDEKRWVSPFAPQRRRALKALSAGEQRAVLSTESYTWDLEPGHPLKKVSDLGYIDEENRFFGLRCSGRNTVELDMGMFTQVERLLWQGVRGFLKAPVRKRPRTKRA